MNDIGNTPDAILGQEFLTWLWFQSDTAPGAFTDKDGQPFAVAMEQRITVEGGAGDEKEVAAVSGNLSPLREARFGLGTGKKVTRAFLQFTKEDLNFSLMLKAENFSFSSFRTPKIDQSDKDEDPDAVFLNKISLLEVAISLLDCLYKRFLSLRFDAPLWQHEVSSMQQWMTRTE